MLLRSEQISALVPGFPNSSFFSTLLCENENVVSVVGIHQIQCNTGTVLKKEAVQGKFYWM